MLKVPVKLTLPIFDVLMDAYHLELDELDFRPVLSTILETADRIVRGVTYIQLMREREVLQRVSDWTDALGYAELPDKIDLAIRKVQYAIDVCINADGCANFPVSEEGVDCDD